MQFWNPVQRLPNEYDYLSNPSDIIDEEEFEESDEEEQKQAATQNFINRP